MASGPFYPTEAYASIRPLILEWQRYQHTPGLHNTPEAAAVRARFDALHLVVRAEDGGQLHPAAGVHITDYADEGMNEPYTIEVLGLPSEEYAHYFTP